MKKFESERNTPFSVILGFIPRIHSEQNLSRHYRACPDNLDPRVMPENDKDLECIETAESGVDKVVSSYEKNPNVHKTYMNFLRQRKTALDAPLHTVSSGRSMIEMLGVLAIIGVLSVGGIAGYSKAMMQFRINQTKQEISEIITNVRTLYAQQKDFNGLDNLPKEIIVDKKYDDGWNQITTPFRGRIWVEANLDFSHVANSYGKYENFNVQVVSLSKEVCIALATSDWGSISSTGVAGIAVGAVSPFGIHQDILKNCNSQGETSYYTGGYYACSGQRISPAIAAQYCKDNSYNNFILTIVK